MTSTYDFNKNTLLVDGVIISNYADGDAITLEPVEDRVTYTEGADGTGEFVETNKNAETLTISLQRTSPSNSYLDELYKNGATFSVQLIDHNDNSLSWGAVGARITRRANWSAGSEATPREWTIILPKVE